MLPDGADLLSQKRALNHKARWETVLVSEEAQKLAEFARESAEEFIKWAVSTKDRRARVLTRFMEMHEKAPRWIAYHDREFVFECLLERIKDFLLFIVQASKGLLERKSTRKLSFSTLNSLRFDILGLASRSCTELRKDPKLKREYTLDLETYCNYLVSLYDLPKETRKKYYFGMLELTQLAATAITFSNCLDNSLQHLFLWSCMLYTAARPGSFVATASYPDCYAKYKHLTILRTRDPLDFIVELKIVSWKGYHTVFSWHATFRLSAIHDEVHFLADPGLLLIAIGLRRNAFAAYTTVEGLLNGRDIHIEWKPELLDRPFFVAAIPKGTGLRHDAPMKYSGMTQYLKKQCGLSGMGEQYMSAYCFRRGSATALNRVLGVELTKSILHHDQLSDTIHKHYILPGAQTDLVSAITTGKAKTLAHVSEFDAPSLFGGNMAAPHEIVALSLEEALIMSPELRLLHMQRDFLRMYVQAGDMPRLDSEEMAPLMAHLLQEERAFLETFVQGKVGDSDDATADSEGEVEGAGSDIGSAGLALYVKLVQRCKKVIGDLRTRHRAQWIERQGQRQRPITIDDIEKRLAAAQQPPDIVKLLRGLVVSERLVQDDLQRHGGEEVVECSAPDLMVYDEDSGEMIHTEQSRESKGPVETTGSSVVAAHKKSTTVSTDGVPTRVQVRRQILEELVSHKDAHTGAQPCPICEVDSSLPPARRAYLYQNWYRVERHMRSCHEPHLTQPYLADIDVGTLAELDPEGRDTSLLHDGHVFAVMSTIDRLFF